MRGGGGTSSLPGDKGALPGGGILCWRFGVAVEVLIATARTITKFENTGSQQRRVFWTSHPQEAFGRVWEHYWFVTVGGWVAAGVLRVKDFSRQLSTQQCTRHPPQYKGSWPQVHIVPRGRSPGLKHHKHPTLGEMLSPFWAWCKLPHLGASAVWPGGLCWRQPLTREFLALYIWKALIKS